MHEIYKVIFVLGGRGWFLVHVFVNCPTYPIFARVPMRPYPLIHSAQICKLLLIWYSRIWSRRSLGFVYFLEYFLFAGFGIGLAFFEKRVIGHYIRLFELVILWSWDIAYSFEFNRLIQWLVIVIIRIILLKLHTIWRDLTACLIPRLDSFNIDWIAHFWMFYKYLIFKLKDIFMI